MTEKHEEDPGASETHESAGLAHSSLLNKSAPGFPCLKTMQKFQMSQQGTHTTDKVSSG